MQSAAKGRRAQKQAPLPTAGPVEDVAAEDIGDTKTTPVKKLIVLCRYNPQLFSLSKNT